MPETEIERARDRERKAGGGGGGEEEREKVASVTRPQTKVVAVWPTAFRLSRQVPTVQTGSPGEGSTKSQVQHTDRCSPCPEVPLTLSNSPSESGERSLI